MKRTWRIPLPLILITAFALFMTACAAPAPVPLSSTSPATSSASSTMPAYQPGVWVRLGGPPGGIGYDIRMRADNPDIMFVTDVNSGLHKSVDGGKTWYPVHQGMPVDAGSLARPSSAPPSTRTTPI